MVKSAVLFSGGKDSVMALFSAMNDGSDVCLLSMVSENGESYMFHVPNIHLVDLIAEAVDVPIFKGYSEGKKEKELDDLEDQFIFLKDYGVDFIYSGALFSSYQRSRIDFLCDKVGLKSIAPFWHVNEEDYMNKIIDYGFEVIITGVFAEGLNESWLGRKIDKLAIEELKVISDEYGVSLAFEGGEAETLVVDGPFFEKRIRIVEAQKQWNFDNGVYIIKKAVLEDKLRR